MVDFDLNLSLCCDFVFDDFGRFMVRQCFTLGGHNLAKTLQKRFAAASQKGGKVIVSGSFGDRSAG